jgi:hypothetical protein
MRRSLQLATAILLLIAGAPVTPAQIHLKREKPGAEDLQWLWQYTKPAPNGNENGLIRDPHFKTFLETHLTAPQSFWGSESLADTALEFLSVPGIARADDNRYITATGCVPHFCPNRGMLFIDTAGSRPLVVFAAIDWSRESHTTDEDSAEYTLWIFPDRKLAPLDYTDDKPYLPQPLKRSLGVFSAELNGGKMPPLVTRSFVIDPDGKPHEIPPSQTGVTRFRDLQPLAPAA